MKATKNTRLLGQQSHGSQPSVVENQGGIRVLQRRHLSQDSIDCVFGYLSGYIMNPVGLFKRLDDANFEVFPKIGYAGINRFVIPEGCELEHEGNMSLDAFKESSAANRLERFYRRENAAYGVLQPRECGARPMTLRGMLFISCHTAVNVAGGVDDFAKAIERTVQG